MTRLIEFVIALALVLALFLVIGLILVLAADFVAKRMGEEGLI